MAQPSFEALSMDSTAAGLVAQVCQDGVHTRVICGGLGKSNLEKMCRMCVSTVFGVTNRTLVSSSN
jgi:hypothetical protein